MKFDYKENLEQELNASALLWRKMDLLERKNKLKEIKERFGQEGLSLAINRGLDDRKDYIGMQSEFGNANAGEGVVLVVRWQRQKYSSRLIAWLHNIWLSILDFPSPQKAISSDLYYESEFNKGIKQKQ